MTSAPSPSVQLQTGAFQWGGQSGPSFQLVFRSLVAAKPV